jgi:hypothetical protein
MLLHKMKHTGALQRHSGFHTQTLTQQGKQGSMPFPGAKQYLQRLHFL